MTSPHRRARRSRPKASSAGRPTSRLEAPRDVGEGDPARQTSRTSRKSSWSSPDSCLLTYDCDRPSRFATSDCRRPASSRTRRRRSRSRRSSASRTRGMTPQRRERSTCIPKWNMCCRCVARSHAGSVGTGDPGLPLGRRVHAQRQAPRWRSSYRGPGLGSVEDRAFPEPYLGRLEPGVTKGVFLALNPGRADLGFQGGLDCSPKRSEGSGVMRRGPGPGPTSAIRGSKPKE
jgi:hypothetical protein